MTDLCLLVRASLCHFDRVRTKLIKDEPRNEIKDLFEDLVNRKFAKPKEYQEVVMTKRVSAWLKAWNLAGRYKREKVGDSDFHIYLPFVSHLDGKVVSAIKPFDLNRGETSEIYDHGDHWVKRMSRLRDNGTLPPKMIFAVQMPTTAKEAAAADEICTQLGESGVKVVPFVEQALQPLAS
ncbi:MAG: hypothetical protein K8R87_08950 [Verrucomicrobia bacterium]|nr:hypothetical protein [Verrucomicrobiota bacterium]